MEKYIEDFKIALSRIDWGNMPPGFNNFPSGCCGDISDILAEYLRSKGVDSTEYVCGKTKNIASHAWIEVDGLVIDFTAQQFEGVNDPIIVSYPSQWHSKFTVISRRKAGYLTMNGPAVGNLMRAHKKIVESIYA